MSTNIFFKCRHDCILFHLVHSGLLVDRIPESLGFLFPIRWLLFHGRHSTRVRWAPAFA